MSADDLREQIIHTLAEAHHPEDQTGPNGHDYADALAPLIRQAQADTQARIRADVAEAIEAIRCGYRSEDGCDYCQGLERAASVARHHGGEHP